MSSLVARAVGGLRGSEGGVDRAARRKLLHWRRRLARRTAWFDRKVRQGHGLLRQSVPAYIRDADFLSLLTAPVIYSLIVPLLVLDVWVSIYQAICFPIYRIAPVPRRRYFAIDRHKLAYLNSVEKVNCTFCSYANGLFAYVREVAARTEQYWCPIRHARRIPAPHGYYRRFFKYGDASAYRTRLAAVRQELQPPRHRRQRRR